MVDVWKSGEDMIVEEDPARYCQISSEDGGGGGGGGSNGSNNNTAVHGIVMDKDEKRMRREIANSNERRRMQSINAGFQSLRQMLPHHEGEKLSKAAILQQTAEYIYALEQEKTRLLSQNCQLKRLLDQHDHNGAVAAAELQQATTQTAPGVTVLTTTAAAAAAAAAAASATTVVVNNGSTGAPVQTVAQVATVAKKRKIDAIIQPVSDSSDEGLGSMSPEPVSLMQVVSNATGTTLVATAVNGRACQAFNVSAKDYLDMKHQLEIERRQKAIFEERLKALERQIYPARVLYQDHPDMVETSEPLEEVLVPTITKTIATKLTREQDNVQLIALDTGVIGKKQLVVCGPEVIEETVQQPIAKPVAVPVKEEKVFIKRSRSRSPPNVETVVTLPPKKNRYPTILEAAIKAEPKVEVERIDSPSSIVVSDDRLSHLTSSKLATPQQQQAASRINTCRHNLETIVEAIRHLEGDAFDNVAPPQQQQHLQPSAAARPVQEVPLALTTSGKHQQKQERDHRQSQLEPYLKFRTTPAGTCPSASSATSSSSSSSSIPSSNTSSNPSGNPAIVSVSITPTVALAAGSCSPSPSATSSAQQTASQILQHHQQSRPGVIVVKQTS
ncbi:uncharacterized protein crp [Ochlerotatus camptorhynchus]|uniref:uncharacterized protein crp n=1 Tax=Ochlerotatus camptorhynchus TaxID=644619 RepID=UPI0031E0C119